MTALPALLAELAAGPAGRPVQPEYRQVELYTKRKTLTFAPAEPPSPLPVASLATAVRMAMAIEAYLDWRDGVADGRPSWRRYQEQPRDSRLDALLAELYRVLRVVRAVAFHRQGHVEATEGLVRLNGIVERTVLTLDITAAGLALLAQAAAYALTVPGLPYPDAYAAAMLGQYYADLVTEIRRFSDEKRSLYQFRQARRFNRHFRFDCDNPKVSAGADDLRFDIPPAYRDAAAYPIDFFVTVDDALHIVPAEALDDGRLSRADLPAWRARTPDGVTLPAAFRPRFGREAMPTDQPMT